MTNKKPLIFKTGKDVMLVQRAEIFSSIIADGKELITPTSTGKIVVPELKDPRVYVTFKENEEVLSAAFDECTSLKEVPEDLFAACPNAKNFFAVFSRCEALESIPENLFAACVEAEDFAEAFLYCSSLKAIPEGLFAHNPKAAYYGYTFCGCSSLEQVPEGLFTGNTEAKEFEGIFSRCTSLRSIPTGLFDNNRKVTSFYVAFRGCVALRGETPYTVVEVKGEPTKVKLWERYCYYEYFETPDCGHIFAECTGLSNYTQIRYMYK